MYYKTSLGISLEKKVVMFGRTVNKEKGESRKAQTQKHKKSFLVAMSQGGFLLSAPSFQAPVLDVDEFFTC
jgi:hypothetical protein